MVNSAFKVILILFIVFANGCEKKITTSPDIEDQQLNSIFVKSNPKGAKIFVDRRNSGLLTPDSIKYLEMTKHKITLKLENYRDTSFITEVDSADKTIDIDFNSNPKMRGRIFVKSNKDSCQIYLNDSITKRFTPDTIYNIIPGDYVIKVAFKECRDAEKLIHVESNKTSDAAFRMIDTSVWVDYRTETSPIPSNYIGHLAVDYDNLLWIGSLGDGLISFDGKDWKIYNSLNSGLPDDYITDIYVDANNNIWVGTLNGAAKFDRINWEIYSTETKPMISNEVSSILLSSDLETIWIGTSRGLFTNVSGKYLNMDTKNSNLPHRGITKLQYDDLGRIWIGTYEGLCRYDNGKIDQYLKGYYIASADSMYYPHTLNFTKSIAVEKNKLWRLNLDELEILENDEWHSTSYSHHSGSENNIVIDKLDRKWLLTKYGLQTFTDDGDEQLFRRAGTSLTSDNISAIAFSRNSNVAWVATFDGGFYKFKRDFE